VIVMSANRDEAVARRALDIAQTRFIAKPSSVAQLLRLVKQAVDLRLAEGPPRVAS
jgi:DNA-binding NtrC family response regulator